MSTKNPCTIREQVGHAVKTWCGRDANDTFEFFLVSAEHAKNCVERGTNVQPCRRCLAAIKKAEVLT